MFDFNMDDDPTGPSDHIRSTLAFLDNNIRMLKKLSQKFQETGIKYLSIRPIVWEVSPQTTAILTQIRESWERNPNRGTVTERAFRKKTQNIETYTK